MKHKTAGYSGTLFVNKLGNYFELLATNISDHLIQEKACLPDRQEIQLFLPRFPSKKNLAIIPTDEA